MRIFWAANNLGLAPTWEPWQYKILIWRCRNLIFFSRRFIGSSVQSIAMERKSDLESVEDVPPVGLVMIFLNVIMIHDDIIIINVITLDTVTDVIFPLCFKVNRRDGEFSEWVLANNCSPESHFPPECLHTSNCFYNLLSKSWVYWLLYGNRQICHKIAVYMQVTCKIRELRNVVNPWMTGR